MNVTTAVNVPVDKELLTGYFTSLVNHVFKILPIREHETVTLSAYIKSLQLEIIGFSNFIPEMGANPNVLKLLSILQYFSDNPDAPVEDVRREVFHGISICKMLEKQYTEVEE